MIIKKAEFISSYADYKMCPTEAIPEYAFIGRSNVGKSSLINMLTERTKLAKVSGRPGKTQLINHFKIDNNWHLVDLPGYGWAKASKDRMNEWGKMTKDYILHRDKLFCLFTLIDSRLEPQAIDLRFIRWLGECGIPFALIFTKCDKQSNTKTQSNIAHYKKTLLTEWEEMPKYFTTSSANSNGREEVLNYIEELNKTFKE